MWVSWPWCSDSSLRLSVQTCCDDSCSNHTTKVAADNQRAIAACYSTIVFFSQNVHTQKNNFIFHKITNLVVHAVAGTDYTASGCTMHKGVNHSGSGRRRWSRLHKTGKTNPCGNDAGWLALWPNWFFSQTKHSPYLTLEIPWHMIYMSKV